LQCVVFCGWRGSGKDTYANHLVENKDFIRLAFADEIKNYCAKEYGLPRDLFDDRALKEVEIQGLGKSPRDLCIEVGNHFRAIDPDHWIKSVISRMHSYPMSQRFAITDCRFPRELKLIQSYFGETDTDACISIWIHRFESPPSNDLTEISLSKELCDYVLDNTKLVRFRLLTDIIEPLIQRQ